LARKFGEVSPSPAADQELHWFFNEAEIAIDLPTNFRARVAGMSPASVEAMERRAEALHAAGKIKAYLQAIPATDALLLAGLYTERLWPRAVTRMLGTMAGAMEASAIVRLEHVRAVVRGRTERTKPLAWLEELSQARDPRLPVWRRQVEDACAIALCAYERVRGEGPSVVPQEGE
jgi:hypothetical protein